jgi:type IX secretion system substrate protein
MKKIYTLLLALLPLLMSAQHTNILLDDNQTGYQPCEPSIVINPKNPDHIVAGAIIDRYYYSIDGGQSWTDGHLSSPYGVWGDPALEVDTAGSFYYFHLSNPEVGSWIDRIVCQKVDEIGGSWDTIGTYMGLNGTKAQDKQWPVVDRSNNNIYVTWTQFDNYGSSSTSDFSNIHFSKSTDGGENWSDAIQINEVSGNCLDEDNTVEGAVPAVGPNGEIYVGWVGPEGLVFDRSTDQGETWLDEDIFISDVPGGWDYMVPGINRCNGLPITKCDLSGGPNHGTIYVNWSDQRNGASDTDVWLVKSIDGGDTWSEPTRVNDDPAGKQQFFCWMDVDQATGYLWFVWYDRRNYDDNQTDVYMAVSRDGGLTFSNFMVSESPFLPTSNIFFGDYTNISAYDNVVRPIWASLDEGELSIYTALVDPYIVGLKESIPNLMSMEQNYPNPFKVSTKIAYKIMDPSDVSLEIYNVYGEKVHIMFENKYHFRGKFIETFEPAQHNLSPGVYFFKLTTETEVLKRTMVFVK